jgi:hypothetical protein
VRRVVVCWALAAATAGLPRHGTAQQPATPGPKPELRVDVIAGSQAAVQLGAGVQIPLGYYVRVGSDVAVGVRTDASRATGARNVDGRLDVLARFLLDPFRQTAYGFSLGGGMSLRAEPGDRVRPLLLAAVELEGRRAANGWVPAVQLGLGGGVRIGVVLRRGDAGGR